MKKRWYDIKAQANNPKIAEITILDEIGLWGVSAKSFHDDMKALGEIDEIKLSINSPGGNVMDGLAIYNMLRASKAKVTVTVTGIAASAASFIAMAGDKIIMPKNSFMMVHNPMTFAAGNASELRDAADWLDKMAASLIGIYVARSGKSEADVKALLDAETLMTADEALAFGFADEVIDDLKITANYDIERLPENVQAAFKASAEPSNPPAPVEPEVPVNPVATQIAALVEAAGFKAHAGAFAVRFTSVEDARAAITEAHEIRALCEVAGHANLTDRFIADARTLADVRAALVDGRALSDENVSIDTAPRNVSNPAATNSQPAAFKASDVWAARRNRNRK